MMSPQSYPKTINHQVMTKNAHPSLARASRSSNTLPCSFVHTDAHRRSSQAFLCLSSLRGNSGLMPWHATTTNTPLGSSSNTRIIRFSCPTDRADSSSLDKNACAPAGPFAAAAHTSWRDGVLGPSSSAHTCCFAGGGWRGGGVEI